MLCPHCRHSHGLHSGPGTEGRAEDGRLLAPDYEAGRCLQASRDKDGSSVPCDCPGWYPDTTQIALVAATMRARAEHAEMIAPPFTLTAEIGRRRVKQHGLF